LCGCSYENSSTRAKKTTEKKSEQQLTQEGQPVSPPGIKAPIPVNSGEHEPEVPTRSELRVLSEQAKATEKEVKGMIEEFDTNLANREARQVAEDKLKNTLPEYKEKMLQLGKAKLKEKNL
jgi:hypothetical protein